MTELLGLPSLWSHEPHSLLRFKPGQTVADIDPDATPGFHGSKSDAPTLQEERNVRFAELQEMLYARSRVDDTRSVLLVLQGMDTAGKGGIVKHVVGGCNPQGVDYRNFGKPTPEELSHHFLWRIRKALPAAGHIGVFDRSHYEDVLIVRVHNLVPQEVWEPRYEEINAFERELVDSGTSLVKVAMFVSLDEQKKRLAKRLERPDKYWKYNPADIDERLKWPLYQEAYQAMLDRTSTEYAPWHVVPCNRKWYSRLAVTELMIEALKQLNMSWPPPDFDVEAEKKRLRKA
ncbi:polyphosphate kinase 2 family protein [Mycolicibacterium rufum]|uniref:Polyphosphate kinase 2 family protein n=1 Tax=Mycolicibacterium rufum TaxID=318424 RepID=A0A9X2YFC2_9MYCO|nr:polyphosphate kinase 2 family protein [Mycolicibacterium rufum]KGI66670.1 polyphosphate kinase [Mycolicibacterium rufum]MCV7072260.1 polyphosphate kinase 2 family protein [Mycolicibacterium rufum]ULP37462.1 polyphosphate kinase 2 family protein [Mycolicibacterium rufum]